MRMLWLVLGLCSLPMLLVGYALLARFALHGAVTPRSLPVSIVRVTGSAAVLDDPGTCRRRRAGEWRCLVVDSEGSGGVVYRVRVRPGSSCWTARVVGDPSEQRMPDISGCVHRWQWSLL